MENNYFKHDEPSMVNLPYKTAYSFVRRDIVIRKQKYTDANWME